MRYLFEHYAFDTDRRELRRGDDVVPTAPQVFDLLDYLICNRARVVSKDDLVNAIWKGRIVSEAALTTRLNAARSAIGDTGEEQRLIKTLPRKGFRFIGTVREENLHSGATGISVRPTGSAEAALPPDRPSIAVLPFENMSDDTEQDHFTDGIVEEIITGLAGFQWLSVVARNSSFAYRGRAIDVRQIGRELDVRFILEGSVRKTGDRIRITGQLIDTATGTHVWADHFDGGLEHAFDLQDQVTASVVGAIEPVVLRVETRRATRKPAATSWERLMHGFAVQRRLTREANAEALQIFQREIQIDPDSAAGYAFASQCYTWAKSFGWFTDHAAESAEGARLARRALDLGRDDPLFLTAAGFGLAYLQGDLDVATDAVARARALNPNSPAALGLHGWIHVWRGEPELALANVERALLLSPSDVFAFAWWCVGAYAHFACGRNDDALSWAERTSREHPGYLPAARMIVASAALGGRPESPEMSLARLRQLDPMLRLSNLREQMPFRRAEDLARLTDGLRKAGLPE
ncbi:winged helix-turn-helix domain-containing protein [Bradyrhizobium sp. UFLA05-109]